MMKKLKEFESWKRQEELIKSLNYSVNKFIMLYSLTEGYDARLLLNMSNIATICIDFLKSGDTEEFSNEVDAAIFIGLLLFPILDEKSLERLNDKLTAEMERIMEEK